MNIAVSFMTTQFCILQNHWKSEKRLTAKLGSSSGIGGARSGTRDSEPFIGGLFALVDFERKEVISTIESDAAAGFVINGETVYIANMRMNCVYQYELSSGTLIREINHHLFNNLHSLEASGCGFITSSSGIDCIVEFTQQGEMVWLWNAADHGFAVNPLNITRDLDLSIDQSQLLYPTLHQSTHVNSALPYGDNKVFATLFHQGTLVSIDKKSGEIDVIISGLKCPHNIRSFGEAWLLPDSGNNRVLLISPDLSHVIKTWELTQCDWIQDVCQYDDYSFLVADSNHNRIIRIDFNSGMAISIWDFSDQWKVYQVKLMP